MALQGFSDDAERFRDIDDAVLAKLRRAAIIQAVRNTEHMEKCDGCSVCHESQRIILYSTAAELDEAAAVVREELA
jgi:hypothetical protein